MSSSSSDAAPFSVSSSFGPFFFAVVLDIILYGGVITLAVLYLNSSPRDPRWMKVLVASVMVMETLHTSLNISSIYKPLLVNFGNYENLLTSTWEATTGPLTTACVAFTVQCFYAWRVKVLTRNRWIVGAILLFSFVQLGGGTAVAVAAIRHPYIPDLQRYAKISIIWCTGAVIADLLITGTLVIFLRRKKTGMAVTDSIINKITRMTLETNLLTVAWVIVDFAVFAAVPPPSSVHLIFNLSVPKFYSTSLLVSLNSRRFWSNSAGTSGSHSVSDGRAVAHMRRPTGGDNKSVATHIYIDVESHEMVHTDSDVKR